MEDEFELRIKGELLKALKIGPSDGMEPSPELVVAASLHQLAVGRGLAQRDDPAHNTVRTAGLPEPALAVLDGYFGADGEPASDDDVRKVLYGVLVELSTKSSALRAMNNTRPLTGDELLEFAQIYWNLDAQDSRSRLPIRAGQKLANDDMAYMKVDGADEDYADLELKQRADRTPGYKKGAGAFYERAARLAALVATRLVDGTTAAVGGARLRSTRTKRGAEWSIVWPAPVAAVRASVAVVDQPTAPTSAVDPMIGGLQQLRHQSMTEGKLGEAAFVCTTLISILQERSEKSPGDHESQLAEEYLRGGLTYGMAGQADEALAHFLKAERASQTLSDLAPAETTYRLQLAVARTMIGTLYMQAGRMEDAEATLVDAVALSQELTDEDASNEDMLAASVGMLGSLHVFTGQSERAVKSLTRAITISKKLAAQNPRDRASQLQLANVLAALGALQYSLGNRPPAEEALTRSLAIVQKLEQDGAGDRMSRLLQASNHFVLGTMFLYSERYEEAEAALDAATSLSRELTGQHADEAAQLTLAGASSALGLVYVLIDREEDGEKALAASVTVSRDLLALGEKRLVGPSQLARASTFLGTSLFYLGLLYVGMERDSEAEASLLAAVRVFEQRPTDEGDQKMLATALDSLADLYREQGRGAEADRALEHRRRLDDQSPDASALA